MKGMNIMIVFQESAFDLPKLSQSSLFIKFDEQSQLSQKMREAIANPEAYVKPETMKEMTPILRIMSG